MKTQLHSDGTISYWSIRQYRVNRATSVSQDDLNAMNPEEREQVIEHLKTHLKTQQHQPLYVSPQVMEAIANLPQVRSGTWSQDYLTEQLFRNFLGLPADYNMADLEIVSKQQIIE